MAQGNGGAPNGALIGGVAAAAVVFAGMIYWVFGPQPPGPETEAQPAAALLGAAPEGQPPAAATAPATNAPESGAAMAAATIAKAAPGTEATAVPTPAFDALRATPEGELTLAGRAEPGAQVEVLLDGQVIDTVTANAAGAFASVVLGSPSAEPRQLTLRITGADGVARDSAESLTVAPSPLALAQAATAAGAAPEAVAEQVQAAQVLAEKPLVTTVGGAAQVLAGASQTLVIDALSFAPDGAMSVSGRGAPGGALLRAYVDNAEAGLVQVGPQGAWVLALPATAAGAHVLRIDALDAAGKVLARAEQGFEGMAPPPPQAKAAPVEAAAEVPPALAPAPQAQAEAGSPAPERAGAETPSGAASPASPAPKARLVTIAPGNTLWALAQDTYGDPYLYVKLFEANRDQIRNPDLIYPGQVFTLPE